MKEKIKVVWICWMSDSKLRKHLDLSIPFWHKLSRRNQNKKTESYLPDCAIWNIRALHEFEKIDEVNLHVVFVHSRMRKKEQRFTEGNIHYYAVNHEGNLFIRFLNYHVISGPPIYYHTWKRIASIVREINPDIIHIMGAENPPYSLSIHQLPTNIPIITQLQTLLHNPTVSEKRYAAQKECEYSVLNRTNYIGSKSDIFPQYIREYIKKDAIIVNTRLILAEQSDTTDYPKQYDFVYWANIFTKGIDQAIEAFGIASKKRPNLTFDVIGGKIDDLPEKLVNRIEQLGIKDYITFEGKLPTHENVLTQIKKARFALLPLRSDLVPSTIREAMWNGLPVITTITQGTPKLNEKRETVLLSKVDDHNTLSENMLRLIEHPELANRLRTNGFITVEERYGNNEKIALEWVETYKACIENFRNATPLPRHIVNSN